MGRKLAVWAEERRVSEEGARGELCTINSECSCPERVITMAGLTTAIFKNFAMTIDKLVEDISRSMTNSTATVDPPPSEPGGPCTSVQLSQL
ncbi:Poly(rC)-binding protein 2 [Heterocephalus glaber]|uniref:Poly(RC)-binding protein 2 n=1 Tax=Heterocephalus glaber TaxID=10181 RepID=G5BZ62_HETGA|nr:Poly(rC)-binding protein 2 [Heterocephalus glaber]